MEIYSVTGFLYNFTLTKLGQKSLQSLALLKWDSEYKQSAVVAN